MSETFRATIQLEGKTATGIRVPAAVVEALGSGKRDFTLRVGGTGNPETKARRVQKAIALMREGRVR